MSSLEIYPMRRQLSEIYIETWDYSNWLAGGAAISLIETSILPASGGPTIATGYTASQATISLGPTTTAGTYVITVKVTTDNAELDLFKINYEAVADTA